jgi:hypothetical protein
MLELIGCRIENGEITYTVTIKTDPNITGTVTGVGQLGKLTVLSDDGVKSEVATTKTIG